MVFVRLFYLLLKVNMVGVIFVIFVFSIILFFVSIM